MILPWIKLPSCKKKLNIFKNAPDRVNEKFINDLSISWLYFMRNNASLGFLFDRNTYKEDLLGEKIRFLHVTPSLNKIKKSKRLNSSGGGLGSVIYCCPLHKDFTPHNLFYLYSQFQLPKKIPREKIRSICIEIDSKFSLDQIANWGVDYTLFGKIHCEVWKELKSISKDKEYFKQLENDVLDRINENKDYLNLLISYRMEDISFDKFRDVYDKVFNGFPELRFILYEVLAEYLLLNQNNKKAMDYANKGEFFNENHKKFIWDLCPTMLKRFNMKNFFISMNKIINYLKKRDIIKEFDETAFLHWFKWRASYYFLKIGKKLIKSYNSFEDLIKGHPYLAGQILYRIFLDKHLFELFRSKYLYEDWQKEGIIIPIYSIVAKGEMGINPNLDQLKIPYSIYETEVLNGKIRLGKKIDLEISPDMINKSDVAIR